MPPSGRSACPQAVRLRQSDSEPRYPVNSSRGGSAPRKAVGHRHSGRPAPGRSGRRFPVRSPGTADRHPVPGVRRQREFPSSSSTAAPVAASVAPLATSGGGTALSPDWSIAAAASRTARPIPGMVMPGKLSRASKFLPRISSRIRLISSGQECRRLSDHGPGACTKPPRSPDFGTIRRLPSTREAKAARPPAAAHGTPACRPGRGPQK